MVFGCSMPADVTAKAKDICLNLSPEPWFVAFMGLPWLTLDDTRIQVATSASSSNLPHGCWRARQQQTPLLPVYTRFQLPHCYKNPSKQFNTTAQSTAAIEQYKW